MEVRLYRDSDRDSWDEYVATSDNSNFYQRIGWKNVLERSLGHKSFYLMAEDDRGIAGIFPLILISSRIFGRNLISMPFLNYGGLSARSPEVKIALLEKAISIARNERVDYIELRQTEKIDYNLPHKETKVSSFVKLNSDPEIIWKGLDGQRRREVRKAEKSGLEMEIGGNECLEGFYNVLTKNMRDLGTPFHNYGLFKNILDEFPESIKIFLVKLKGEPICGAIAGFHKDTVEGLWFSANKEYSKLFPAEYSYWHQIKYACEKGYRLFNLGRSTKDSGSHRFKQKWNVETRQLYLYYYLNAAKNIPELNVENSKFALAIKIWKKLPITATKYIGPKIARILP